MVNKKSQVSLELSAEDENLTLASSLVEQKGSSITAALYLKETSTGSPLDMNSFIHESLSLTDVDLKS